MSNRLQIAYDGNIEDVFDKPALKSTYEYIGITKTHGAPIYIQTEKSWLLKPPECPLRSLIIRDWKHKGNQESWIGTVIYHKPFMNL